MRIGILGPTYPYRGGIAHHTTLLFRHLRQDHEVLFLSFKRQYPAFLFPGKSDKDDSSAPLIEEGVEYLLDSINPVTWFRVARRLRKFAPDLLVIPWWVVFWAPQVWLISRLVKWGTRAKILFLCHNVIPHEENRIESLIRKMVLKGGDYFIVQSSEEKEQLERLIVGARVERVFHPTYSELGSSTITSERTPEQPYKVLIFGFIREYKGLKYLIDAIAILRKDVDVRLVIAGEFWEDVQEYRRQIESLGISEYVEVHNRYIPNEELDNLFESSDVVALPYISVTGSGALQLALAYNKPVITSAIGSLREIILDGFNGFTVPPRDPQALASAIRRALDADVHKKVVENIKSDRYRFSWDNLVKTIEHLYSEGEIGAR